MNPFDLLTEREQGAIECWIEDYALEDESSELAAPLKDILRPWAEAKGQHLLNMFGNKLRISSEVSYEKPFQDILDDFEMDLSEYSFYNYDDWYLRVKHDIKNGFAEEIEPGRLFKCMRSRVCNVLKDAIASWSWDDRVDTRAWFADYGSYITSYYNEKTVEFPAPFIYKGKPIKLIKGSKFWKTFSKMALCCGFDETDVEMVRVYLSTFTNQKTLKGIMTLSIHPLDYMTMSDNDCDWSSCMSWKENGCYRQGTVEMMNSPSVVVAYLESMRESFWMTTSGNDPLRWSNKKWRVLLIVDPTIGVISIKSYPYNNNILTQAAVEQAKTLFTNYDKDISLSAVTSLSHYSGTTWRVDIPNTDVRIRFATDRMYNDFQNVHCESFGCFTDSWVFKYEDCTDFYNYSGLSECMLCGATNAEFESESCVVCVDCDPNNHVWCACCEERINEEDSFYIDGNFYCAYCFEQIETVYSRYDDDTHLKENVAAIFVTDNEGKKHFLDYTTDIYSIHRTLDFPSYQEFRTKYYEPSTFTLTIPCEIINNTFARRYVGWRKEHPKECFMERLLNDEYDNGEGEDWLQ